MSASASDAKTAVGGSSDWSIAWAAFAADSSVFAPVVTRAGE
jgi:hypothetical protein